MKGRYWHGPSPAVCETLHHTVNFSSDAYESHSARARIAATARAMTKTVKTTNFIGFHQRNLVRIHLLTTLCSETESETSFSRETFHTDWRCCFWRLLPCSSQSLWSHAKPGTTQTVRAATKKSRGQGRNVCFPKERAQPRTSEDAPATPLD